MKFKDEYVLEPWGGKSEYDLIVSIESDNHNQLFIAVDTRGSLELGNATIGNLDNDAIDGIIALLERARTAYNS